MAWLTTTKDTLLHYYMGSPYVPQSVGAIRYNDPKFKFNWPHEPEVISDKDRMIPDFMGGTDLEMSTP